MDKKLKNRLHPAFDIVFKLVTPAIVGIIIYYYINNYKKFGNTSLIFIIIMMLLLVISSILLILSVRVWYDSEYIYIRNFIKKGKVPLKEIDSIKKPFFYVYKMKFKEKTKFGKYILISCELRNLSDNKRVKKFKLFMAKKFPENKLFN